MRAPLAFLTVALAVRPSQAAVYDRTITVFSPDGKLMQVAYAEEAVQRGRLAVAASNGRDTIVMCLECPRPQPENEIEASNSSDGDADDANDSDDANSEDDDEDSWQAEGSEEEHKDELAAAEVGVGVEALSSGRRHGVGGGGGDERRQQRRRILAGGVREAGVAMGVADDGNNQDRKLCEVDEGVYMAFAGVSADGRVLASKIRLECQSYRYSMGAAPSMGYIARYVGGLQHRYTRTGGARPYGVSCLVAGFDDDRRPRVFRSEPSGAFAEWTASAVGKASEKALKELESVPDIGLLDWRGAAEAAVRATLAGGALECDVVVLRRNNNNKKEKEGVVEGGRAEAVEVVGDGDGHGGKEGDGWRHSGGGTWTKRFLGSVRRDGAVVLGDAGQGRGRGGGGVGRGASAGLVL